MTLLKDERMVLWVSLVVLAILTYWPVFSTGRLPGGEMSDTVAQGYPFFSYTAQRLSQWELPLWNPYILCGTPFYESFSAPVFYPLRGIPMLLLGPEAAIRFLFPVHMVLGGIFAWLLLKAMGTSRWGSLAGSWAYAGGAWANTLFYAGHGSKIICWAWFPLILWAVLRYTSTRRARYIGIGALAVGMQGLSSHPQMMLYSAGAALILALFRTERPVIRSLWLNLGGTFAILALGGLAAAVQLYPGYVFSGYTSRGADLSLDRAASYSLPPEETLTMVLPGMFGLRHGFQDSTVNGIPVYFGRLGLRLSSEFMGVAFFLLGMAGLLKGGTRRSRFTLASIAICGMVVSWGGYAPVFQWLYRLLPVFRKLRAPHMAAFLTTSAIALAAGPGFDALFLRQGKAWKTFAMISGAFLLLLPAAGPLSEALQSSWWARSGVQDTSPYGALVSARASLLSNDFLRAFLVSGALSLLLFMRWKNAGNTFYYGSAVMLISALELIPFNGRFQVYLPSTSIEAMFPDSPLLAEMTGDGRVFPGGNHLIPLGIRSVTGYHAAKTVENETLLDMVAQGSPWVLRNTAMTAFASEQGAAPWDQVQPLLAQETQSFPDDPMPRAFLARSVVAGTQEEGFTGLQPQLRTIVENTPMVYDGAFGVAEITMDRPELVRVSTSAGMESFLVLADTWYPMWRARVDGEDAEVRRANGWMRAVAVPAGEHTVEFIYDTGHVKTGGMASLAGLLAAALLVFIPGKRISDA